MSEAPNSHPDLLAAAKTEIAKAREQHAQADSAIRLDPLEMVAISAGVGFVFALLLRR
jgi:ElaB/YqjD/DUF883 family membrane-anchored ribosome-binding protein